MAEVQKPNVAHRYRSLHAGCSGCVEHTVTDVSLLERHTKSHNFLQEFERLTGVLITRPEYEVYELALKEYELALFAVAQGLYRYGFMGLRLFLELMLSAIRFSANEMEYRLWVKGARDVNWNAVVDSNTGLFSYTFLDAFFPDLFPEAKHYNSLAISAYRECSQFVHGNKETHAALPLALAFDDKLFYGWHDLADTARLIVIFAFAVRFVPRLNAAERSSVDSIILDTHGHLPIMRSALTDNGPPQ